MRIIWTNSRTQDRSTQDHICVTYDHRPRRVEVRTRPLFCGWYCEGYLPTYPLVALGVGPVSLPVDVSQDIARWWPFRRVWGGGGSTLLHRVQRRTVRGFARWYYQRVRAAWWWTERYLVRRHLPVREA